MTTKDTIEGYFDSLSQQGTWQTFLADDMTFTNFGRPRRSLTGKDAFLEGTEDFYAMISAMEVKELVVEGEKACALTRYDLEPRGFPPFESHVAEVFEVRDGTISRFDIYFDSAPYPKPSKQ